MDNVVVDESQALELHHRPLDLPDMFLLDLLHPLEAIDLASALEEFRLAKLAPDVEGGAPGLGDVFYQELDDDSEEDFNDDDDDEEEGERGEVHDEGEGMHEGFFEESELRVEDALASRRKKKKKSKDALTAAQAPPPINVALMQAPPPINVALMLRSGTMMSAEDVVQNLPLNKRNLPKEKITIASRDNFRASAAEWHASTMEIMKNKNLRRPNGALPAKSPFMPSQADREQIESTIDLIIATPCKCGKGPCYLPLEPHLQSFVENMLCMKQKERIYVMKCFLISSCRLWQIEVCDFPIQLHSSWSVLHFFCFSTLCMCV